MQRPAPTRAINHPPQMSKRIMTHQKHGETLDVDELFRRLERHRQHLEEARDRRRAKVKKTTASEEYRHVPQCAAADFVCTTTADVRSEKSTHPLSRSIVRTQIARPKSEGHLLKSRMPVSQVVQNQDLAQLKMVLNSERNQFTQSSTLARAAEADKERNIHKLPQRDFDFSRSMPLSSKTNSQRDRSNSSSNRTRPMTEGRGRPKPYLPAFDEKDSHLDLGTIPRPHHIQNHTDRRHDWSQNETVITGDALGEKSHPQSAKTNSPFGRLFASKSMIFPTKGRPIAANILKEKTPIRRKSSFFALLFHRTDPIIPA